MSKEQTLDKVTSLLTRLVERVNGEVVGPTRQLGVSDIEVIQTILSEMRGINVRRHPIRYTTLKRWADTLESASNLLKENNDAHENTE